MNHLPSVSGDYKLLYVFIPMVLLARDSGRTKYETWFTVLLGLFLIPKAYILIFGWPVFVGTTIQFEVTEGVILNPLIGLCLVILVLLSGSDAEESAGGRGFPLDGLIPEVPAAMPVPAGGPGAAATVADSTRNAGKKSKIGSSRHR